MSQKAAASTSGCDCNLDCKRGVSKATVCMAAISDLSLADVLHQAPTMLKFLQLYRSLDALLATNTGMRHLVQQYVTHITIPDQSHMHTFAQDRWPNLQRMSFKSVQDPSAVVGLSQGGWQISTLKPTFAKLELDAIVAMRSNIWPWQKLTDLAVYFGEGLPAELHMLSTCRWQLLESLTLCSGRLDDARASLIFRADWPLLQNLWLPFNRLTDLEGVDHSRWPQLESVCLKINPVSKTGLQRLVSTQWPKLNTLNLSYIASPADRPTFTWHQLIMANWPMLSSLELRGNRIEAVMMKNIVEAQFGSMRNVNLSNNSLDSVAIGHFVKGYWMHLWTLDLTNALCGSITDCLVLLSTGAWPQLGLLWLGGNGVDVTALPALAKSKWPSLYCLNLEDTRLSSDDFRLMGGDAACDEPRDICRKVSPKLRFLEY